MITNLIEFTVDLSTLLENVFNTVGSPSLLCVLGSHLLIHLREAAEERLYSVSAIDFEHGAELSEPGKH